MNYYKKYIKYKKKYNHLIAQYGGVKKRCFNKDVQLFCNIGDTTYFCRNKQHRIKVNDVDTNNYNLYKITYDKNNNEFIFEEEIKEIDDDTLINVCGEIKRILVIGGGIHNLDDTLKQVSMQIKHNLQKKFNTNDLYRLDILDSAGLKKVNKTKYYYYDDNIIINYNTQYKKLLNNKENYDTILNNTYDYIIFDWSVIKFIPTLSIDVIKKIIKKLKQNGQFIINGNEMHRSLYQLNLKIDDNYVNKMNKEIYDIYYNTDAIILHPAQKIKKIGDDNTFIDKENIKDLIFSGEEGKDTTQLHEIYLRYITYDTSRVIDENIEKLKTWHNINSHKVDTGNGLLHVITK